MIIDFCGLGYGPPCFGPTMPVYTAQPLCTSLPASEHHNVWDHRSCRVSISRSNYSWS